MSKDKSAVMTMQEATGYLAQGVINITEDHTTIMPTSKIHTAMKMIATPENALYLEHGPEMVSVIKGWACSGCAQRQDAPDICKQSFCRVYELLIKLEQGV